MNFYRVVVFLALAATAWAADPDLSFKSAGQGFFEFDTGVVRGRLQANEKCQGIPTFRDAKTDQELAHGGGNPGLLSYYRLLSANHRWAHSPDRDTLRLMPNSAKRLPDGAVQIHWPASDVSPIDITATYRWKAPNVLDLQTTAKPARAIPALEVFLSSYFNKDFRPVVYLKPARHTGGKPDFVTPNVSPLVVGTYLAFPRDLSGAKAFYDGRWELGHNPVQWSVTRYYAAPIVIQRNVKTAATFVLLGRPQDCFAVDMPYNADPPDGVAGHRSVYFSLFGQDFNAAQAATAHNRLIIGPNISNDDALKAYNDFLAEKP